MINLMDDVDNGGVRDKQDGDNLALVFFDGEPVPAWEAFTSDWETDLVASTIILLSQQNTTLDGGFDMSMLNNMNRQPAYNCMGCGSASSVAFPTPDRMLALPAPPGLGGIHGSAGFDQFTMSTTVPPPVYVSTAEMGEMERRVEEEKMWGQHVREGMNGQSPDMDRVQYMHPGPYFMQDGYPLPGSWTYKQ